MINNIYNLLLIIGIASVLWMPVLLFFYIFKYQDSVREAKERFMKSPWGISSVVSFILSCVFMTFIGNTMTKYAQDEISSILKESPHVYINGNRTYNKIILKEIKNIGSKSESRNWNDSIISIRLVKNTNILELKVERNNDDSTLYRVYYPKYHSTKLNAIGEIKTKCLNNY